MKISDILIEQGPISHSRPKVVSPLNKQVRDAGHQMLNRADQNTEQGPDKAEPSDETKFNQAMGKTITTGKIDPNLEQSGRNYATSSHTLTLFLSLVLPDSFVVGVECPTSSPNRRSDLKPGNCNNCSQGN